MVIKESILPEFEHEMETTRLLLGLVPASRADWRPHPKSRTLGELACHVADLPRFVPLILGSDSFDAVPPEGAAYTPYRFESPELLVARLDENVSRARDAIKSTPSDAEFMVPWSLKRAGKTIFTVTRKAALRTFLLNHLIHHRGQLTVYLRLQDVPLPSVYGPTADNPL